MSRSPSPISLKARALQALALREHSRSELRTKLLRVRRAPDPKRGEATADAHSEPGHALERAPEEAVEQLLDELQAQGLLCEARFVESRVHARAQRFGNRRIQAELARHGLRLEAPAAEQLRNSELARAQAVWQRKFGQAANSPQEQARQARFLAGRGFSPDTIRRVVRGTEEA